MSSVDHTTGQCFVYTFKDGLLSSVAHDLKLCVTKWQLTIDEAARQVRGTFDATSLRVVCVMRDGREDRSAPSERDRRTIEGNIVDEVLDARRYPTIAFDGTWVDNTVDGTLDVHGVKRPLRAMATRNGDNTIVRVTLDQTTHRIKPYSAMLGTLKVKATVQIELVVPHSSSGSGPST